MLTFGFEPTTVCQKMLTLGIEMSQKESKGVKTSQNESN